MPATNVLIGDWSTGVWQNIGSPATISALSISGYAYQPATLGSLNSRIGTCYSGSGWMGTGAIFSVSPDLNNSEISLIDALYHVTLYNQLSIATMGFGGATVPFTKLREGDSQIELANPANIGKVYLEAARDWTKYLNYLIVAYHTEVQNSNTPRSVAYLNPPSSPYIISPYGDGAGVLWR